MDFITKNNSTYPHSVFKLTIQIAKNINIASSRALQCFHNILQRPNIIRIAKTKSPKRTLFRTECLFIRAFARWYNFVCAIL